MEFSDEVIIEICERSLKNLRYVSDGQKNGKEVYEVTQLVNSFLSLIILAKQKYYPQLCEISIPDDWPTQAHSKCNMAELLNSMRNAIAHNHLQFEKDDDRQISGITLTDGAWTGTFTVDEATKIVEQIVPILKRAIERT